MDNQTLKHILISVLIGACVSFLSTLFSGLLGALSHYSGTTGGGIGAVSYLIQVWKTNRIG